jgi:hypothetical protein
MLILRGLTVALGGFVFIFLPGAVVAFITRRDLRFETSLLLWGMGLLIVTLFPALFLTNLLRLILFGEGGPESAMLYIFALGGSIIAAVFLEVGKYLLLRWRRLDQDKLLESGILIGLGVGLLTNVFQGISLVGAGLRLVFGDTSTPDLAQIASQGWLNLITGLVSLNVYRVALVALSAALGGLVARALLNRQLRWLWLAVAINALAAWSYNAIGLALGTDNLTASLVALVYQGALAALVLYWLTKQVPALPSQTGAAKSRAKAHKR